MNFWELFKKNREEIGTISTIIISLSALAVSLLTAQYTNLQTTVTKAQNAPAIKFQIENKKGVESLKTINVGGPAFDFKINTQTYIRLKYSTKDNIRREKLIPINGYFFINVPTYDVKDLLNTEYTNIYISTPNKDIKVKEVIIEFNKRISGKSNGIAELIHVCDLSYTDLFGDVHKSSYLISGFERKRLDVTSREIFNLTMLQHNQLDADGITLDQVLANANEMLL